MEKLEVGRNLYNELLRRFPEARPFFFEGAKDLSYLTMISLADWLRSLPNCASNAKLVERLKDFCDWAIAQPPGDDASDDILTNLTVGFLEQLFESTDTIHLIP